MKKVGRLGVACMLLTVLLSGCGQVEIPDDVKEPALAITDGGQVTACLVGEFNKFYYDLDELAEMAKAEAAAYGGALGETAPVRVDGVKAADDDSDRVVVTYIFSSPENYEGFTGETLFYGTVSEAVAKGYSMVSLQNVKEEKVLTPAELLLESQRHLIVTKTAAVIYCPDKVTHISQGAVLNQDGSVDASGAEGLIYILLKK